MAAGNRVGSWSCSRKRSLKPKQLRNNSGWEMLGLEEALTHLERMPRLPSIEDLAGILRKCRKNKNLAFAQRLLSFICRSGLEAHRSLGNYLVPMLVEVGSMHDAQQVFNRLPYRNEHSWTSLITGYIEGGELEHALSLYQKMQEDCVHPSGYTFVALLKACTRLKDVLRGGEVHAEIARQGLERDSFVGNTLVNMYSKCGVLSKAQEVLEKLPVRDAVSWNPLIAAYVEHGLGEEALNCFERMLVEGIPPNALTLVCILKACGSIGAIDKGQEVHAEIAKKGWLDIDPFVGNALVDMYAKCGSLVKAQEVFDKLPARNAVSWNALIARYAKHELGSEVLNCFEWIQLEGLSPEALMFVCSLKACASMGAIDKGCEIHAEIIRQGLLERDPVISTALLDMYAKCGSLAKAREVFDKLPIRNSVSWNTLVAGYTKHGVGEEALNCFEQMQLEGASLDAHTFVCSLKACGSILAMDKGQEIHGEIASRGLLERHPCVGNALVDMYGRCGSGMKAQEVFDKIPIRNAVSWNALIVGYAKQGLGEEALNCFEQMQLEGVSPDALTFLCTLKACGSIGDIAKGQEIHGQIASNGLLERYPSVGNALVDMYAKCGSLAKAQEVFDKLPVRDVVTWTALIAAYIKHGLNEEVLYCYKAMHEEGICPSAVTFIYSLKACGSIGAIDKGREIHALISKKGLFERDPFVGSSLVGMYAKCGSLAEAEEVFHKVQVRDAALWNALIASYTIHGFGEEALNSFKQMQLEGVSPDALTFACSLKACGSIGATCKGQELHNEIARKGLLKKHSCVGNALIDMYAKCGLLAKAQEVFSKLPTRDIVSWTALIAGYAYLGESEKVFRMLEIMTGEGIKPDQITLLSVLTVCSHTGLVDVAHMYFEFMRKEYSITPTIEHHTSMVDLLGRAGQLDEAVAMIEKMPVNPSVVVWHTVLGACQKLSNMELGRQAFEHAVQLDGNNVAAYVLMSNVYADTCTRMSRWLSQCE